MSRLGVILRPSLRSTVLVVFDVFGLKPNGRLTAEVLIDLVTGGRRGDRDGLAEVLRRFDPDA